MSSDPDRQSSRKLTPSASGACADFLESANLSMQCAQFDEALVMYEQVLDLLDQLDAPDVSQVEECLSNLIDVYMFLGRPQDALATSKRMQNTEAIPKKDKRYVMVLLKTAAAWERVGALGESEKTIWQASEIAGEVLAADDPVNTRVNRQVLEIHRKRKNKDVLDEAEKQALLDSTKKEPLSLQRRETKREAEGALVETGEDAAGARREIGLKDIPGFSIVSSNRSLLVVSLLLLFCAGFSAVGLSLSRTGQHSLLPSRLQSGRYRAADLQKSISFTGSTDVDLSKYDTHSSGTYKCLTGGFDDFANIVTGCMRSHDEVWLQMTDDGLVDQDGTILYADGAPEFLLARKMGWYADLAASQYSQTKLYPANSSKLEAVPGFKYSNPFTGRSDSPSWQSKRYSAQDQSWTAQMKSGSTWADEPPFRAGAIHCLCLDYCRFFVRAFDRHGAPITSSNPGQRLIVELKDGINISHNELADERAAAKAAKRQGLHIFISDNAAAPLMAAMTRQLLPIVLWVLFMLSVAIVSGLFIKGSVPKKLKIALFSSCLICLGFVVCWYLVALSDRW